MKKLILLALLLTAAAVIVQAQEGLEPDLPAGCEKIQVEEGNTVAFRVYAVGVQVYRWNGSSWDFVGPIANLFADEGFHGKVGTHYATPDGPAWESNSGSVVVAKRKDGCDPDPTAISWLLLQKHSTDGPGIFNTVSFIQRVNTAGGLRPTLPGSPNEERRVPYTTEYLFYRAEN